MQRNDGGQAFPVDNAGHSVSRGMSLRDWFAGQALASIPADDFRPSDAASLAYRLADAMLAFRDGGDK